MKMHETSLNFAQFLLGSEYKLYLLKEQHLFISTFVLLLKFLEL